MKPCILAVVLIFAVSSLAHEEGKSGGDLSDSALCLQNLELCRAALFGQATPSRVNTKAKRAYDFVRFGRSDPLLGKEKKNTYDYIRRMESAKSLNDDELFDLAVKAMNKAYCPYSKFKVGAALQCEDGTVFSGGNVESASYGGTICAERCALVTAIAHGQKKFTKIAVVAATEEPCSPCGICRQLLFEFGEYKELLPHGFGPSQLNPPK